MRVLIVDPLSYIGHVNYNYGIIRGISLVADYSIIVNHKMEDELQKHGIKKEHFLDSYSDQWNITALAAKYKKKAIYHILFRLFFLKVILQARKLKKEYDFILFISIDIISFSPISWLFNQKCGIIDHGIGNMAKNRFYKTAWKMCNHQIKLVTLEEYIKDFVLQHDPLRKTYVIRHPLPENKGITISDPVKEILIFGPSASNDADFVNELKDCDLPEGIQFIIKGRESINKQGLNIYSERISDEQYNTYLNQARYILLAYDSEYNYRASGVLFEAAMAGKPVLILNNNTLCHYKQIFNDHVYLFKTTDELMKIIVEHSEDSHSEYDLSEYTDEGIGKAFSVMCEG